MKNQLYDRAGRAKTKFFTWLKTELTSPRFVESERVRIPGVDDTQRILRNAVGELTTITTDIVDKISSNRECIPPDFSGHPSDRYECLNVLYEALNNSEDIICLTDAHSKIIYVNKKYLITYGFRDTQDVIGRYARIVSAKTTPKMVYDVMWSTIRTGKAWDGIIDNKSIDGDSIKVHSSIVPITSHTGTIDYYICVQRPLC
ncbi:MAG: PAS domain-containing protein [bacterium]